MELAFGPVTLAAISTLTFAAGWLVGHFQLLDRLIFTMDDSLAWARQRDRTGKRDLAYRLVAKPLMALHLFGLHPIRGTRAYRQVRADRRRGEAALAAPQTAGDVLCAALRTEDIPAWKQNDGGPTYVLAVLDPAAPIGRSATGPFVIIGTNVDDESEGDANRPAHEHPEGWTAWLHLTGPDGVSVTDVIELYTGTGGDCAQDSAECARAIAAWRDTQQPAGRQL